MVSLAIMQPYWLPYIGYFKLISTVDEFIVYDNIQFTKKGWINRNRVLVGDRAEIISLPLKRDHYSLDIKERVLADTWPADRLKLLSRLQEYYRKAPFFKTAYPVIEKCLLFDELNLFHFIFHSLLVLKDYLKIMTPLIISSSVQIDHSLKNEKKVLALCHARGASTYVNPIGGVDLYSKEQFAAEGVELRFLGAQSFSYKQFEKTFVPALSIVDVIMFNDISIIRVYLESEPSFYSVPD